jgi:hypothetical protein
MMIFLIEVNAFNPVTLREETLRFCTGTGFIDGVTAYVPRVKNPGSLKYDMFQEGQLGGSTQIGYGEITLQNLDGKLDFLMSWGFDGRKVACRYGPDDGSAFDIVYTAVIARPNFEAAVLAFTLRDKQYLFDVPLQPLLFKGDNALPEGVEGTASDLKNRPKPLLFGRVFNAPAVCVNTARLVYALNARPTGLFDKVTDVDAAADFDALATGDIPLIGADVLAVCDKGLALAAGAEYADLGDLMAAAPAAGYYRVWPEGGLFRLGSSPAGTVTAECLDTQSAASGFDAAEDVDAATDFDDLGTDAPGGGWVTARIGELIRQMLVQLDQLPDTVSESDLAEIDSSVKLTCGLFLTSETMGIQGLDTLCRSALIWWGFDRLGRFRVKQVRLPLLVPALHLKDEILAVECLAIANTKEGVPARGVRLRWRKNHQVQQPADLAGGVDLARQGELAQEWRTVEKSAPAILERHPLAPMVEVDTVFYDDPTAEAQRQFDIYQAATIKLKITVPLIPRLVRCLDLGFELVVTWDRYGCQNGRNMMVLGVDLNCDTKKINLIVWG